MFKNRISHTSQNRQQFFIRRYERVFGPEAAFVESVCANLIESRFGLGRLMPVIVVLADPPQRKTERLKSAKGQELVDREQRLFHIFPFRHFPFPSLGRKGYQGGKVKDSKSEKAIRQPANDFFTFPLFIFFTSPCQGRGSP